MSIGTIILIILVIALLGGFSGIGGGPFYGTGYYGGGGLGLVIVILLILLLMFLLFLLFLPAQYRNSDPHLPQQLKLQPSPPRSLQILHGSVLPATYSVR